MPEVSYVKAVYPDSLFSPVRILGIRLRPISVSHLLFLEYINSPLFSGDYSVIQTDRKTAQAHLLISAIACSMTEKEFKNWVEANDGESWKQEVFEYGRDLQAKFPSEFDDLGRLSEERISIEFIRFGEYINPHLKTPDYKSNYSGESIESGGHRLQNLTVTAASNCGYSVEQAHDENIMRVAADVYKYNENIGLIHLMTDDEVERRDNWQKYIQVSEAPKDEEKP